MSLSKQQIFSAKPKTAELEVPEWGGIIRVRPITLQEQGKLADLSKAHEGSSSIRRLQECTLPLIFWTALDENGDPLFTKEDIPSLLATPAAAIMRIQEFVLKFSGLTEESRKELEKNSPTISVSEPST